MELTGSQRQELHKALLSAFPQRGELAQLVNFTFNENLNTIVSGSQSYANDVFELIQWLEAKGRLDEFIAKAQKENPNNQMLRGFVTQYRPSLPLQVARRIAPTESKIPLIGRDDELNTRNIPSFQGFVLDDTFSSCNGIYLGH